MAASSAQEIWEAALGELQVQVTRSYYRTWLEKTTGLSYEADQFVVGVPNAFVAEYLNQNQRSLIEKTLIGLTRPDIKLSFRVATERESTASAPTTRPAGQARYTFDSFVVSNSNRLAYAAALGAAEDPGHGYNPLFLYGGVGLGKTHLLHAVYHAARANHFRALYVSAEQFTNEFVSAVRERSTEEFRRKFRNVDILLIDDIQFISGKEQTEESFFHTFNELHNANRQIVMTSDCPPKAMPRLGARLCSRFEWGLVADIQPPDFETRLAILRAKAEQEKTEVPPEVLEFIAQRIQQNIRELEGSLHRAIAYARLFRALLTPELAARALEDIAGRGAKGTTLNPERVIKAVAQSFQLSPEDLKGRKRDRTTALARQLAMYLLKEGTSCSLAQIGLEFGKRDHSTVTHAVQRIATEMNNDPYLRRKLADIQHDLSPKK
jgi:chromosomal replication initiator protein